MGKKKRKTANDAASGAASREELLSIALEQYDAILMMYELYEEKRPIMLFDVQKKRIYAFPYLDFRAELNERSQRVLTEQYQRALIEDQIVVFVKDNVKRTMRSFSMDRD